MRVSLLNSQHIAATLLCGGALFLMLGCGSSDGPPRATVTGTVTVDGVPLNEGSINFIPTGDTAGPVAGGVIKDGVYQIVDSVCVGTNRIEIRGRRKTGRKIKPIPPAPPDLVIEETVDVTPPQFNSDSTLKESVELGENTLNFDLKTKM